MKCKIEIEMDDAAFEDNPRELEDILINATDKVVSSEADGLKRKLLDSNGNVVGWVAVK
jgi:hypothetical protein